MTTCKRLLGMIATMVLFCCPLASQTSTGSISGVVHDESGAVIPNAKITVTDIGKGISQTAETESAGRYHIPALIPGDYEIQVQMEGFQTEIRKGIQLTVGMDAVVNFTLTIGQVAQTTVVTAQAPLIETVTGTVSGLVDEHTIRDLPLNGRSFDQLISLQSSAPLVRYRTANSLNGPGAAFTVAGARSSSNLYLMDGTEQVGVFATSTSPGGALGLNLGIEAVQEFTVLESTYSAAYGKRSGAVINIATRSGTNALHGSAYEFLRNSDLDARNFFDRAKPSFRRNQFGAALGGPIRKDQTFFFGNYEGLRQALGLTNIAVVPNSNALQGLLPDPQRPGQLLNVGLAPTVRPFLVLFPQVNGRDFGDGTGEALSPVTQVSRQDFFLIRIDHKISDNNSLFARYNFSDANFESPDLNPATAVLSPSRDQILTLSERRSSATTLNLLTFGFTRSHLIFDDVPTVALPSSLNFLPGAKAIGSITFGTPNQTSVPLTPAGTASSAERKYTLNQFDIADQIYHYRGAHSLQFGAKMQRMQENDDNVTNKRGTFQFPDLVSFLTAKPSLFTGPGLTGGNDSTKGWRLTYLGTFIQDDVKLRRNLTLNLGVRWEFQTSPTEASGNRISNYVPRIVNGLSIFQTNPVLGAPLFHTNFGSVAPRIGFAWDTFGNGKMAVRGGFGMFHDQVQKTDFNNIPSNPPFFNLLQVNSPPFPAGFSASQGSAPVPAPNGIDPNVDTPTRVTYSLSIEREVTSNTVARVGYVGSHAYHLWRQSDFNTTMPQILPGGVYFFRSGAPRKNPLLGSSRFRTTDADAYYNSLQWSLVQRPSHGIRYKLSYTFSKSMDDASSEDGPSALGNPNNTQNPDDLKGDRGLSAHDIRHNFVANVTYDLPGQKLSSVAGRLFGGWQISAITSVSSGAVFTALTGFNRSLDGDRTTADRPNLVSGASNNPVRGGPDRYFDPTAFSLPTAGFYGNLARNTVVGPGFVNVDFTIGKRFVMNERASLDFRSEFFNILNRANFGLPNQSVFNTNGQYLGSVGRITTTSSASRQIQFGLKLLF